MLSSHNPRTPRARNPVAVRMAIRHPASRPAIAAAKTVTPNHVRRSSCKTNRSTVALMPLRRGTRKSTKSAFVR